MSTAVAPSPAIRAHRRSGLGRDPLAGTGALLKFALRRDGIRILAWVCGVEAVALSTLLSFSSLYPDAASRAAFADSLGSQPAFAVLTGKIFDSSLGGLTAWRVTLLGGVLAGLMSIFTVIRRTRTDEEAGRTELLASAAVGRAAPLLAALGCALAGCVGIFVLVSGTLLVRGEDAAGALTLGLAIAGAGLLFAGVAAITAQLFDSARPALGTAGLVLGISFGIRAIADSGGDGSSWLRWLSPLGWAEEVRSFAVNRFWVIGMMLTAAVLLVAVALWLLGRRDIGLGLFPARFGRARGTLESTSGLSDRLHRPAAIGWTVALAGFGLMTGAIVDSAKDLFADSARLSDILTMIGGPGAITDAVLNGLVGLCAILASIAAVSAAGRMITEEQSERAALLLSTTVSRSRWQADHLLHVFAIPVVMLMAGGLASGILHGARSGDFGDGFTDAMAAMLGQLPACWVIGAVAVLIHAWLPRIWVASWVILVVAVLLGQLGPLLQLPQWLNDLVPFPHVSTIAGSGVPWLAELVLLAIAAALTAAGIVGFARRDLISQ
jgi:ABC-2 type transport system permease protein